MLRQGIRRMALPFGVPLDGAAPPGFEVLGSARLDEYRALPPVFFATPTLGFQRITPRRLPTFVKAAMASAIWASEWAAESWTRMRALPRGTTGKEKPIT